MSSEAHESSGYTAEEYREKRLIQTILDGARDVKEQRRRAEDFLHNGVVDEQTAQRMYRMALEDFIIDSRYKIQETDQTVEVETEVDQEPEEFTCWEYFWHSAYLGSLAVPGQSEPIEFFGLKSIRDFPDPLEVPIRYEEADMYGGKQTTVDVETFQVPWQVTKKGYEELLDFWGMHGLHVTTDDGVPTWSFNEKPDEPPEEAAEI